MRNVNRRADLSQLPRYAQQLQQQQTRTIINKQSRNHMGRFISHNPNPQIFSSIFLSGGIGDVLTLESFFSDVQRHALTTIYYATNKQHYIQELFQALPNYPNLKNHVVVWNDFSSFWCFFSKEECISRLAQKGLRDHGLDMSEDFSINVKFPLLHKLYKYSYSSFVRHRLANISKFHLPRHYICISPFSSDKRVNRDFSSDDWNALTNYLSSHGIKGVVLNQGSDHIPHNELLINLNNQTNLSESIEILKNSDGYIGIDSCLSVLATKLFDSPNLVIKSNNGHLYQWKQSYYAPQTSFDFINGHLKLDQSPNLKHHRDNFVSFEKEITVNVNGDLTDIFCVYKKLFPYFDKINLNIHKINFDIDWLRVFSKIKSIQLTDSNLPLNHHKMHDILKQWRIGKVVDYNCLRWFQDNVPLEDIDSSEYKIEHDIPLFLESTELPYENYIVLCVNFDHWLPEQWLELVKNLDCPIVLIGKYGNLMSNLLNQNNIKNVYVNETPNKLLYIIKNSQFFIGCEFNIFVDNLDVNQIMITNLEYMKTTWAKKKNIENGTFSSYSFRDSLADILDSLSRRLRNSNKALKTMKFLVPQGIGDSVWGMLKVQDIAKKHQVDLINVRIACFHLSEIETRACDFLKRFKFINSAEMLEIPLGKSDGPVLLPGKVVDANGLYRYIPDGKGVVDGIDYVLLPNSALERGIRLENWLPEYKVNWNIMDEFQFTPEELEYADNLNNQLGGKFIIFYMGSESGNLYAGHNRGSIWRTNDWVELGNTLIKKYGVKIVIVGASYDATYYEKYIYPLIELTGHKEHWHNHINQHGIAETFAICKKSKFIISYQSGIGIVSSYMKVPTGIFWRAKGDSLDPNNYVSFEEDMAHCWVRPDMIENGKHLPLIYGRHDVNYILNEIEKRKWYEQ